MYSSDQALPGLKMRIVNHYELYLMRGKSPTLIPYLTQVSRKMSVRLRLDLAAAQGKLHRPVLLSLAS
jgi:hypothetical protein